MELKFRGVRYTPPTQSTPATETPDLTYRGVAYQANASAASASSFRTKALTFRGQSYTAEIISDYVPLTAEWEHELAASSAIA